MVWGEKHYIRTDEPDEIAKIIQTNEPDEVAEFLKTLKPFELDSIVFECSVETREPTYIIYYRPLIDSDR